MWLRKRSRGRRVKRHVALHLLHGLMNVPVEHGHRTKALEVRKRLSAIFGSPTPFGIHIPQGNMSKHDDWRALGKMLGIGFQPSQLFCTECAKASGFKVRDVDQADEMHTLLL